MTFFPLRTRIVWMLLLWLLPMKSPQAQNLAGDEALSKVLIENEGWQLVADGLGFADGACSDAEGNFYFMDLGKGTGISRVGLDGKVTEFLAGTPKCSGLKWGPDGRLYACTQAPKKQVVALEVPSGKTTVLADDVQPNDLVVSSRGYVYFTETGKGQVTIIGPDGKVRAGATGIQAPNGITLSPDQGTLAVSEYRGTNVWAFRVGADGGLDAGSRYMELRTIVGRPDSGGDGSATDQAGRYYVTSHLGIQMFDGTGRMGGVIAKPTAKACVSVAFAGANPEWLYACASDKIFRRKTRTRGAVFAQNPWRPLFNGRDLSGWVNVNCSPGTFSVSNEIIVSTGVPTGILRSDRAYENFELELEYRHMKAGGNAGLFVWADPITSPGVPFARAIEVQILDGRNGDNYTSHGDVFAIHGATFKPDRPHPGGWMRCLPSERRAHPAGDWNHYHVLCSNGVVQLAVNGKAVSGGTESRPRQGYLCLESEGSECHFRNIRIRELPSTNPAKDERALAAEEFQPLYTGIDLSGWKVEPWHMGHWEAKNWTLVYDGKAGRNDMFFWTQREFGDFVLVVDWRLPAKPKTKQVPLKTAAGADALNDDGSRKTVAIEDAGDSGIYIRGSKRAEINIWCQPQGSGELTNYRQDAKLPERIRKAAVPGRRADRPPGQWNRFVITARGQSVTVELNGERVIDAVELPDLPARGPVALQYHGDPIEFANLFVKSLH